MVLGVAAKLGIKHIWLQPGTHDAAILKQINDLGLQSVQACVLVALR
jgi:predicted CoA-binding protein